MSDAAMREGQDMVVSSQKLSPPLLPCCCEDQILVLVRITPAIFVSSYPVQTPVGAARMTSVESGTTSSQVGKKKKKGFK